MTGKLAAAAKNTLAQFLLTYRVSGLNEMRMVELLGNRSGRLGNNCL